MSGQRIDFPSALARPAPRAGWLIGLGIVFVLLGILAWADAITTTLASTVVIGVLMLCAGVAHIAHAMAHRNNNTPSHRQVGVWLPALIGVLYVLGGIAIIREPIAGSVILTAFLAVCLIFAGITRAVWAVGHRQAGGWWALLLSGLVALVIGVVIYASLPLSGLWLIGTVVAIELVIGGVSVLTFGLSLRRRELGLR